MSALTLNNIHKAFGAVDIIKGIDLAIEPGEFVVFVGPSGCGKSTLLRIIAGLESATSGEINIGGRDVTHVPPAKRGIAMVFQSYALFPHLTVADNITFGLRLARTEKAVIEAKLREVSDILQLTPLLERHPKQLSGGQRQRVAIGRAIIRNPQVFLFDEPLSNLDAALRVQMRLEIARLHRQLDATMIYVTHDQVEAMTLADKIVVMNGGRIEQVGSPKMNFLPAKIEIVDDHPVAVLGAFSARPSRAKGLVAGTPVSIGIRPENLTIGAGSGELFVAKIVVVEHLGDETIAYVTVNGLVDLVSIKLPSETKVKPGDEVQVNLIGNRVHIVDQNGWVIS